MSCCRSDLRKKYGQWALVTGSTDGIGLAMVKELAKRGLSIIVVGRNEEKLNRTKETLLNEPNVGEVMTIKADLSDSSIENYERIKAQIDPETRGIGILINNAGTFGDQYRRLGRADEHYLRNMVNVNILATVFFTRMIIPSMVTRGRGLIMNVSSMLGILPAPFMDIYGPTKSFVNAFSNNLQIEYSSHPIDIVNLETGPVLTKLLHGAANLDSLSQRLIPTADEYARSCLNAVTTPVSSMTGVLSHGLLLEFSLMIKRIWPFVYRMNLNRSAKDCQISPVPKRKEIAKASGQDQAGDR